MNDFSSPLALTPNLICISVRIYIPTENFSFTKVNFFFEKCQFFKKFQSCIQILADTGMFFMYIIYIFLLFSKQGFCKIFICLLHVVSAFC